MPEGTATDGQSSGTDSDSALSKSAARSAPVDPSELAQLRAMLAEANRERRQLYGELAQLRLRIREIKSSIAYRASAPIRLVERAIASLRKRSLRANVTKLAAQLGYRDSESWPGAVRTEGAWDEYRRWIDRHDRLTAGDRAAIAAEIAGWTRRPLISVVMPVHDTPPELLSQAIASVREQIYAEWELCIVDDASRRDDTRAALASRELRAKVTRRNDRGGIAAATNTAIGQVAGEFVVFLDHDDLLAPHALYMVAREVLEAPDATIIYSDSDAIDDHGRRHTPFFKPDWDPELILGQNYMSHLCAVNAAALHGVGGLRDGFDGSQDWDLILRLAAGARPEQIRHIPFVLYHWREGHDTPSFSQRHLDLAVESGRRAVVDALRAQGSDATVIPIGLTSQQRVKWRLPADPPAVTAIVPTRDQPDLLARSIDGLLRRTTYPKLDVIIVDNGSHDPRALEVLGRAEADERITVLRDPSPFNFAALVNRAARRARGSVLALVNDDVEPAASGWLAEMTALAVRPEVGVVGAMLYYPDDTIQHGGIVLGPQGAEHAHRHVQRGAAGYFGRLTVAQSFAAVTAACMVLRSDVFSAAGGMDEALAVELNDVDLCLRIRKSGLRVVWTPHAELYHRESATRGPLSHRDAARAREWRLFVERWPGVVARDPAYNPNLAIDNGGFRLAFPPRVARPWGQAASAR